MELADYTIDSLAVAVLQLAVFEWENFRGKKVELSGECKDVWEKTQRVGSVIVESGPWVIQFPSVKSHQFFAATAICWWKCAFVHDAFSPCPQVVGVWASRFCRRAVCPRERRVSSLEHLDQLAECLQPELISAPESGQYYGCNVSWCDLLPDMLKPVEFLSRTVQITSCTCLRIQALKAERWRFLTTTSPVCGLMVSRTAWPVLKLSVERKL